MITRFHFVCPIHSLSWPAEMLRKTLKSGLAAKERIDSHSKCGMSALSIGGLCVSGIGHSWLKAFESLVKCKLYLSEYTCSPSWLLMLRQESVNLVSMTQRRWVRRQVCLELRGCPSVQCWFLGVRSPQWKGTNRNISSSCPENNLPTS